MDKETQKAVVNLPAKELDITPITITEIEEEIKKRVSLIDQEFNRGFDFIKNQSKSVTFFGSSRLQEGHEYYEMTRSLSYRISELGYTILSGGGPGIMEAANRGAFEAQGRSFGMTIKLPNEQVRNPYITDAIDFYYFFTRKVMLSFSAEAYVFLPGGFGTFDEMFEILTLVQTHKIHPVPIILYGSKFWNAMKEFMVTHMLANDMIEKDDLALFTITDSADEIIDIIKNVPVRNGVRLNHNEPSK